MADGKPINSRPTEDDRLKKLDNEKEGQYNALVEAVSQTAQPSGFLFNIADSTGAIEAAQALHQKYEQPGLHSPFENEQYQLDTRMASPPEFHTGQGSSSGKSNGAPSNAEQNLVDKSWNSTPGQNLLQNAQALTTSPANVCQAPATISKQPHQAHPAPPHSVSPPPSGLDFTRGTPTPEPAAERMTSVAADTRIWNRHGMRSTQGIDDRKLQNDSRTWAIIPSHEDHPGGSGPERRRKRRISASTGNSSDLVMGTPRQRMRKIKPEIPNATPSGEHGDQPQAVLADHSRHITNAQTDPRSAQSSPISFSHGTPVSCARPGSPGGLAGLPNITGSLRSRTRPQASISGVAQAGMVENEITQWQAKMHKPNESDAVQVAESQKAEQLRLRRIMRNRESARRSRLKSKSRFQEMERTFVQLKAENEALNNMVGSMLPACLSPSQTEAPTAQGSSEKVQESNPGSGS